MTILVLALLALLAGVVLFHWGSIVKQVLLVGTLIAVSLGVVCVFWSGKFFQFWLLLVGAHFIWYLWFWRRNFRSYQGYGTFRAPKWPYRVLLIPFDCNLKCLRRVEEAAKRSALNGLVVLLAWYFGTGSKEILQLCGFLVAWHTILLAPGYLHGLGGALARRRDGISITPSKVRGEYKWAGLAAQLLILATIWCCGAVYGWPRSYRAVQADASSQRELHVAESGKALRSPKR